MTLLIKNLTTENFLILVSEALQVIAPKVLKRLGNPIVYRDSF